MKKTTGSAPKWILEVRTPRPSQVDVGGLVLDGIFAFSKCELVFFFSDSLILVILLRFC